jgi:hypothetical protein
MHALRHWRRFWKAYYLYYASAIWFAAVGAVIAMHSPVNDDMSFIIPLQSVFLLLSIVAPEVTIAL